jgi:hypothetical protein
MVIFFLQKCGGRKPKHDLAYNVDVRLYKKVCEIHPPGLFPGRTSSPFLALTKFHDFSGK